MFPVSISQQDGYLHLPANSRLISKNTAVGQPSTQGAIFLDRDGVLVEDMHYLRQASQLRLLPGVADGLLALQSHFYLVVVTNQSGIARGLLTEETLLSIHSALVGRLSNEGVKIDAMYYCPHLPDAPVTIFNRVCQCRKPEPGMLLKATEQWGFNLDISFMIGDQARDIEAGQRAGVRCIRVGIPDESPHPVAQVTSNFLDAANIILSGQSTVLPFRLQ